MESLITDDNGAVVGVRAVSTDGNTDYTVSAANVILATGGYGNNKEMLTDEMKSALYYGPATSTGEGIQMAQAVGAQTANMEYGKRYPNGIEVDTGLAKSTIAGNIAGWTMSAILVNQEGNRVVNEKASNRTILETELQQTGGELFLLLDSETFEVWKSKLSEAGISESDIEKYLEANGTTTPVFAHGETLEEAAAAAGIDADALKATYTPAALPGLRTAEDPGLRAWIRKETGDGTRSINDFVIPYAPSIAFYPGSTDVGDVSWLTPTAQFHAVTWTSGAPGHSWQNVSIGKTAIAHKGMLYAADVLAGTAADLLESPALLERARVEFRDSAAEGYDSPLE